jgi:putative DNA primase/helicase
MSKRLDAALEYVEHGFSVIPLQPKGKTPLLPSWAEYQKRPPTAEEVSAWFEQWPDANIGLVTGAVSGIAVVDIDSDEGAKWADKNLPKSSVYQQTGKGYHIFYKANGTAIQNKVGIAPGVDVRGEGGYIVIAPSIHPSDAEYKLIFPEGFDGWADLADFPKIQKQKQEQHKRTLDFEPVEPGLRNSTITRIAGKYIWRGLDRDAVLLLCHGYNTTLREPLPAKEVETIVDSIWHKDKVSGEKTKCPEPLPDELLPVAAFDYDLLPDSLRPWVKDICERMQCPPDFVAVGVMVCLATVIGRKVGIRPQSRTDWTVIPNCWGLIIGRPGILKSPALEAALEPLKRLSAIANKHHQEAMAEYRKTQVITKLKAEAAEKAARKQLAENPDADLSEVLTVDEVDVPVQKRYLSNDPTPASLGALLIENPKGLLVHRDEIVSLLKSLDREENAEGRGFYLTGWNGDSAYTIDRIGRGLNLYIEAVCISLLGGTQPGRIAEYIRHAIKGGAGDDGLIQRFGIGVWPDNGGAWKDVDRWPDNGAKNQAYKVFDYLDKLAPATIHAQQDTDIDGNPEGVPYLRFAPEALGLFLEWRIDLENRLRGDDLHPALESHFSKYRKLIPALALIIHLAEGGTGPVSRAATLRALAWGEYLETHARRIYSAGAQPTVATAKMILKKIRQGHLAESFSSRDIWRKGWAGLSDREHVAEGLRMLVEYGWLVEERVEGTGGRPATRYSKTGWQE